MCVCVLHYYSRNAIVTTITCACGNGNRSRKFLLACPLGVHLSLSCFFFLFLFYPDSRQSLCRVHPPACLCIKTIWTHHVYIFTVHVPQIVLIGTKLYAYIHLLEKENTTGTATLKKKGEFFFDYWGFFFLFQFFLGF